MYFAFMLERKYEVYELSEKKIREEETLNTED
jgi:hypothetical protein